MQCSYNAHTLFTLLHEPEHIALRSRNRVTDDTTRTTMTSGDSILVVANIYFVKTGVLSCVACTGYVEKLVHDRNSLLGGKAGSLSIRTCLQHRGTAFSARKYESA